MSRKGYAIRLSALQIQSLVSLCDKLGDMGDDPILESIFTAVRDAYNDEVIPAEMGQIKPKNKRSPEQVPKESLEVETPKLGSLESEAKEALPDLAEGTKQLVETMSEPGSKKK